MSKAKVLLLDIETSPIVSYTWGLYDQNIGLNQIKEDSYILSWSAKWLDNKDIKYKDLRNGNKMEMLRELWKLLDECDIAVGHNSNSFDLKRINAQFALNGLPPPSPYRKIDTMRLAKKHFGFTSNSLDYLSKKLCTKHKKTKSGKYPGMELWVECLKGNKDAWNEMEKYNKKDVLTTEELYKKLLPWDTAINFDVFHEGEENVCSCGSKSFKKNGTDKNNTGVFQRYKCTKCGHPSRSKENLLSPEKRKSLRK